MRTSVIRAAFAIVAVGCGAQVETVEGQGQVERAGGALTASELRVSASFVRARASAPNQLTALAAQRGLKLNDRVNVVAPGGAFTAVENSIAGTVELGVTADAGAVTSLGDIFLRDRSCIFGDATAGGAIRKQNGTLIVGASKQGVKVATSTLSIGATIPFRFGTNVWLEPDQAAQPGPGSYGALRIGSRATATLQSGTYLFTSLSVEPDGTLLVDNRLGAVQLFVSGAFDFKGRVRYVTAGRPNLVAIAQGTTAIFLSGSSAFQGSLIAPRAALTLASVATPYAGFFGADTMEVHQDNRVEIQSPCSRLACPWEAFPAALATPVAIDVAALVRLTLEGTYAGTLDGIASFSSSVARSVANQAQLRTVGSVRPAMADWHAAFAVVDQLRKSAALQRREAINRFAAAGGACTAPSPSLRAGIDGLAADLRLVDAAAPDAQQVAQLAARAAGLQTSLATAGLLVPASGALCDPDLVAEADAQVRWLLPETDPQTAAALEAELKAQEAKLNSVGDDAQLANVDLQNMLQKQQQTLQMMSNISKMLHDTAMAVIRKIGG